MEKVRLFLVVSVFALLVAACGGGETSTSSNETPTQPVSVSLSDLSATIEISTTHQFSATVDNADDTSVDWQVNKVTGGESTVGTISESGLYTAPDRVPSPVTVTVTAVAHADATKEASATVTIMSNVTVAVSPADTTLPAGETVQFSAAIEYANDTAAKWTVNDVPGGDAAVGTIAAGLYTAPALPPPGGSVTITAISLADTSKTDSVNVAVQFSNASLNGAYVFSVNGNTLGLGQYYAAGRFVADGKGNIVSGTEDLRQTDGVSAQLSLTGTYEVQPERGGSGILTLNVEGFTDPATYVFELTSSGEGPLIRYENSATGSGQIYKQDTTTFSNASMDGSYAFQYLGANRPGTVGLVGMLSFDGSGNISAGTMDMNGDGEMLTKVPLSGSYIVEVTGRTVLTLTMPFGTGSVTLPLTAYLISTDRTVLTAPRGGLSAGLGMAEKQQITSFSNASFSGDFVFFSTSDPATKGGSFLLGWEEADGAGAIIIGVLDASSGGTIVHKGEPFMGTYSIPPTDHGRGTVSINIADGTGSGIFYVVSEQKAFMLSTDTARTGQMVAQQSGPFSVSSLKGDFVFSLRGIANGEEVSLQGELNLDGSGALTGDQAVNIGGFTTHMFLTGNYFVTAMGPGDLTISDGTTESTFSLYVVDSSHAYLIETDASGTATFGSIEAQF